MIIGNGSCQDAAKVALSLSQARDVVFKDDFLPFSGLYNTVLNHGLFEKSPSTWKGWELAAFRDAANSDADLLEHYSAEAKQERKPLVVMVDPDVIASPFISGWAGYAKPLSEADRNSPVGDIQLDAADTPYANIWNRAILTDKYLCSWEIVFVFDHPLDSATDCYRLIRQTRVKPKEVEPLLDLYTSLDPTRTLLRFLLERSQAGLAPKPLIIHKNDLNHDERGVIEKLCEKLGLQKPQKTGRSMSVQEAAVELDQEIDEEDQEWFDIGAISEWEARLDMKILKWEVEFGKKAMKLLGRKAGNVMPSYYSFAEFCLSV